MTTFHHYFRNCTGCPSQTELTSNFVFMSSNPLPTSHHHTYPTCYNRMSHRVPYALPQRTSWLYIAPSPELVRVLFLLVLQTCGTHYHHIFAMQLHINNSKNYLRLTCTEILDSFTSLYIGTSWVWISFFVASSVGAL